MLPSDIENLTQLLDRNAGFTRPEGQTTGFTSEQPKDGISVPSGSALAPVPAVSLPATIVDKQLNLPDPSMSRKAKRAKQSRYMGPQYNELWSEEELCYLYNHKVPPQAMRVPLTNCSVADTRILCQREEPDYDVLETQSVSAEDLYIGVDFTRDPSTSDGVVVKVRMPKLEEVGDIHLTVEPFQLYVSSTSYYLNAALPRRCIAGKAEAQWDSQKKFLVVHLFPEKQEIMLS